MGSKGSATTKQSYSLPPEFQAAYKKSIDMATAATSQPYQAYQGQLVAGLNPTQLQGISNVNAAQGMALPAIGRGMQLTERAAQGITPELYNQFYSPYVRDVADTTFANMMESAAQQRSGLKGGAIQAGAFGGDRAGIAQAEMARQQQLGLGQTMSGIYNQGYGQAMQLAGQQAQNYGAMGQQLAGLGVGAQGSVLQGAQAQLAAGAQQQATDQAQLQAAYEQWMQRQSYPYQQAQFFANIAQGLGSGAGGTSTTSTPGPSWGSQALGALGAIGSIASLSDERMKENIEAVGTLNDGQTIYRYNFKGDPKTQIGLLAQEVEEHKPGAVTEAKGLKMVNYKDATDQSASMGGLVTPDMQRQNFADGGVPYHPYESRGYVPEGKIGRGGRGIPEAPEAFKDEGLSKDWKEMMPLTKEQVGGLKALADKLGIALDRPEKSALGLIGASEYDVNAPKFEDVYPDKEYYTGFASGGVVGRNGYFMGGEPTMEDAMNEAGLAAAEEPEAPSRLLQRESGGDFGASNEYGASGRAQFMPARMIDLKRAGVVPPEMTPEEFRDNPEVQKAAEKWHFNDLNEFIDRNGLAAYEGKVINGVPVTREGMVNVAHLGGPGGLVAYLKSGGRDDRKDPYGTKLSDYMAMGAEQSGVAGATVQPMADTEAVMPEEPRSRFDLKKLIASEDNPSIIESIMGRRLSPEARAAVMNASFAMLAGRSPFMGVNIGEAGKVGMQTYYNALQQQRELAKQQVDIQKTQADTAKSNFEIQRANAEFFGPYLQDAMIRNNGILPENMRPLLERMGPFAQAYISAIQAPIGGQTPGLSGPQPPVAPGAGAGVAAGEGQATTPIPPPSTPAPEAAPTEQPEIKSNVPFADQASDPGYLTEIINNPKVAPAAKMLAKQKLAETMERLSKSNGIYIGADGQPHVYSGWQELIAQQEGLKTSATEAAKAPYDLVEVIDPATNQKIKIPRSEALKTQNVTELSPLQSKGIETLAKQQEEIAEAYPQLQAYRNQLVGLSRLLEKYQTGMGQPQVGSVLKAARALGFDTSGLGENSSPEDMEKFIKGQYSAVFKQIASLGSRFTNLEMANMIKANPNPSLEPEANASILAQLIGAAEHDMARQEAYNQWITENPNATDFGKFLTEFYSDPDNLPLEFQKRAAKDIAYIGMDVPTLPNGKFDLSRVVPGKRYVIKDEDTGIYYPWYYNGEKWVEAPEEGITP